MKYLSKLLSMLLIGGMLFATGCTDYDQDIKDINRELNEINDQLNGRVNALDADLDAVETALKGLIDEANDKIAANETAINNLKAVDAEHDAAIAEAKDAIAAAVVRIATLETQLTDLTSELKALEGKHDTDIAAVRSELATQIEAVNKKITDEVAKVNDAIADAVNRIKINEDDIAALKEADEKLAERVKTAEDAIALAVENIGENAEAIAKNADNIAKNAENIAANAGLIQANADAIAKLTTDLVSLTDKFTAFQAETKTAIEDLQTRVATAEEDIDNLEKSVEAINALNKQQDELLEKHGKDLENLNENLDSLSNKLQEVNEFTENLYKQLVEVEKHLESVIAQLGKEFGEHVKEYNGFKTKVDAQFLEAFGKIADNATAIAALEAKHDTEVKSLMAQDAAILETLEMHRAWLVELEESIATNAANIAANKGLIEALTERVEANEAAIKTLNQWVGNLETDFKQYMEDTNAALVNLEAAIEKALADAKAYAEQKATEAYENAVNVSKAYADELDAAIKVELAKINEEIKALKDEDAKLAKSIADYKEEMKTVIAGLNARIDEVIGRVQSIVFVPEYSDGKGTINYAMAGNTIVEGRSTMVYQVYPAECAALIANAVAVIDDEATSPLSFIHQDLKNRDTRADNHKFNIVGVTGDVNGRLVVTVDARNLGADFYAGKMEYAVALVLETELENLSSAYTNVVPGNPEKINMSIVTPDVDGKDVDITGEIVEPTLKIQYNNTTDTVTILEDHKVKFTVGGKDYYGEEALNAAGYALDLNVKPYAGTADAPSIDPFKLVGANEDGTNEDGILEVSVAKVDESLIGPDHAVEFGYYYTAGGLTATAGRAVETTPITAMLTFEPVVVTWTYANDAAVDAAFFANKAQTAVVYQRDQLPLKVKENENTLPEDTTIEDVLSAVPDEVVVNDIVLKDDSTLKLGFNADGELAVFAISGFAFEGEPTYNIVATYELHNVTVTVKATVVTKDRNRNAVNVTIQESTVDVCKNLEFTMRDSFGYDVYNAVAAGTNMGEGIDAKYWMTDNFVTKAKLPVAVPKIAGLDCSDWKYAYFRVYDWEHIDAVYSYRSSNYLFQNAGWTIPRDLNYECEFTTWYGQVIKVSKVVKFNLPKFDFAHNEYYVFEDDTRFYSQVAPEYTFNPEGSDAIETYTVANVELKNAFLVIDENNQILDKALMDKYGLVVEYIIEDEKHPGIEMVNGNEIVYLGSMDEVNVYGYLYIQNSDSAKTRIQLPTSFDNNDAYGDYVVKKFNPIKNAKVYPCEVYVNNDKPFTVNPLNYISLRDDRRGAAAINKPSYDLIDLKLGAWVMGDGENGFAAGKTSADVYGLTIDWTWSEASVPAQLKDQFVWNEDNTLTFKNTNNMALTKDVKLSITLTIENVWMEPQEIKVPVTFKPAQGFTPAE